MCNDSRVTILSCIYWKNASPWALKWRSVKDTFFLFPIHGILRFWTEEYGMRRVKPGEFIMLADHVRHRLELAPGFRRLEQIALHCHVSDRWQVPVLVRFAREIGKLKNPAEYFEQRMRPGIDILSVR